MSTLRTNQAISRRHRGAAMMVMLVILIMGVSFFLVSSLSKVTLQAARNEKSADLLAQAKEVIIGYAIKGTGGVRPGDLMIPDVLSPTETPPLNYDGMTEGGCLDASKTTSVPISGVPVIGNGANMRCVGRLPWKQINMPIDSPSENDPTGFMPWYAVSANLVDPLNVAINSELLNLLPPSSCPPSPASDCLKHNWLTVRDMNGNVLSNRVAFIVMIPGPALPGQSRPLSTNQGGPGLNGSYHYLDSITVPGTCTPPCVAGSYSNADMDDDFIMGEEHRLINDPSNPGKQIEDPSYNFNDKLLYVTIDELMPLIEKRIAREVKACLDDYAAGNTNNRYPWAASAADNTGYPNRSGAYNVYFGRVPEIPNISIPPGGGPPTGALLTYIKNVQTALDIYIASPNPVALSNLRSAGDQLKDNSSSGSAAHDAGTTADNCSGLSCTATLQTQLNIAMAGTNPDLTMTGSTSWTPSCSLLLTSTYWPDWRDLVFYQVAEGFRPGGGTFAALQIGGSGNRNSGSGVTYRAAVLVAGKKLGNQSRASAYSSPPIDYLSNGNALSEKSADPAFVINSHDDSGSSTSFITYKTSDPYYQNVNDLVICVDGKNLCQ